MKLFKYFLTAVIIILAVYFGIKNHFSPTYHGQINMRELSEPVDVYYDFYGIPHISAKNRADLYRAYGYVVMQDRYFQIQMQKMISAGRLSEWFGPGALEMDKTLRNLGTHYYMSKWYQKNKFRIQPELLKDLESWLAGANECLRQCPRPLEFVLMRVQPEPLTVEDVLAFSAVMSFTFTKNYFSDALLTQISQTVKGDALREITGTAPAATATFAALKMKSLEEMDPLHLMPQMEGSQSWVLSPQKSASGHATLANDPHIGFTNPGVWYEAHLKAPDFELYGHFVPIIPFALIGHNTDKAWGLTMGYSDDLDLLIEPDPTHFTERVEKILVKGEPLVELKLKDSSQGPVINELLKKEQNAILSWHYYRDDNFVLETFYDLAHAKSLDQYYAAIKKGRAPGLNILWADKTGNIAWKMLGYFPLRKAPFWQMRPVNSDSDVMVEDKFVPQLKNPVAEYILSANQKPPVTFDETKIFGFWDRGERYQVLKDEMESTFKIDLNFQKKMFTNNTFSEAGERLKKMLSIVKTDEDLRQTLVSWNGKADLENQSQGFYHMWIDEVMKLVLQTHFNTIEQEQFCSTANYWKFAIYIIDHPQSTWWQNQYPKVLQIAFDQTLQFFQSHYGDKTNWSWKNLHTVEFEHPLGKVKYLRPIFNLGPYSVDGGSMIPNAFRHKFCSNNFNVTGGASTRRLIDFQNPLESWGILPTGNSGAPLSPHFSDQVQLYLKGEFRPQIMEWTKIEKISDHLIFTK